MGDFNKEKIIFFAIVLTTLLLMGWDLIAPDPTIPPFLKVGKSYEIILMMTKKKIEVLEINEESGWMKVKTEKNSDTWLNISQIPVIIEIPFIIEEKQ